MSIDALVEIVHSESTENWKDRNESAFGSLFGSDGRYPKAAEKAFTVRAPEMSGDNGIPFCAYIHPSNPKSGAYSGLSFVMFPVPDAPCLIGLVVGTQGLNPDEAILGRPGHARKSQAICSWLGAKYANGESRAWAKSDPTRTDITVPESLKKQWPENKAALDRYEKEVYALFRPCQDKAATAEALKAFLDLLFAERGFEPLKPAQTDAEGIRQQWFSHLMPPADRGTIQQLLTDRRFVILQGPPGTGKTTTAQELLENDYKGFGRSIQFHPNTTYESFVGGLSPIAGNGEVGLRFSPIAGHLMEAAAKARRHLDRPYLLHIDEINRADLSKVLGEAIYLFEPNPTRQRKIALAYDFPEFGRELSLPQNLHVLGTMNTSDRSIAIVDVAVRRRFGFVSLWPEFDVVQREGCELMQQAFINVLNIFVEHATEEAFNLVPGHSYFLERDEERARRKLKAELLPLLEEYLSQGYVGGFSEPLRTYIQWLKSL
jgi:5-methylcytosine-specific restriction protein B